MKVAKTSIALLIFQLLLVSSIAARYLYQRATCPRVWTRAAAYDPELVMRGRYIGMSVTVDACDYAPVGLPADPNGQRPFYSFPVKLSVRDNKIFAKLDPEGNAPDTLSVIPSSATDCHAWVVLQPVNFYIPEHAASPLPVKAGEELWVEVTVPPNGPPRPIQLARKLADGSWKPLAIQ